MNLRIGDRVLVSLVNAKGERLAKVSSQGRDSGGPWVNVELENGELVLIHPDRILEKR